MKCKHCESGERRLWPANRAPKFEEIAVGNWQSLLKCSECQVFWVEVPHEPYALYHYAVLWPFSLDSWKKLKSYDEENGTIHIHEWHQQVIREEGPKFIGKDQEAILAHQERSYGLEPYNSSKVMSYEAFEKLLKTI